MWHQCTCRWGAWPGEYGWGLVGLTEDGLPDEGEGGLGLCKDHREVEEEEKEEEDDLEEEVGRYGGEPVRPLDTLERRAQTSSSNCLTSRCRGKKLGTTGTVKMKFKDLVPVHASTMVDIVDNALMFGYTSTSTFTCYIDQVNQVQ